MDAFHVVIDTSVLWQTHFQHANFEILLRRARKGTLKIYIPQIVLEEQRTRMLEEMMNAMNAVERAYLQLKRGGTYRMFAEGLPETYLQLWKREDVIQHTRNTFDKFLSDNKIEKLPMTERHGINAWARYFDAAPPFNPQEARELRRADIPDSWILEAALEIKEKRGRHCALVGDRRLKKALLEAGFEIFLDVASLDDMIEKATAVTSRLPEPPAISTSALNQLRSSAFEKVDQIILGVNEALGAPSKDDLFTQLELCGIERRIAEHEAQTLLLSGRLVDSGNHYIPTDRALARIAMDSPEVTALLLKIVAS